MATRKGARAAYAYRSPAKHNVVYIGVTKIKGLQAVEANGRMAFEMKP